MEETLLYKSLIELKDKYNGEYSCLKDTSFSQYYFKNYEDTLNNLPKDISEFLCAFPYLQIRGWTFTGISSLDEERLICLGGIYLGLGYRVFYVMDRNENNIKLFSEGYNILRQYKTWTEALKELVKMEFDWKFI